MALKVDPPSSKGEVLLSEAAENQILDASTGEPNKMNINGQQTADAATTGQASGDALVPDAQQTSAHGGSAQEANALNGGDESATSNTHSGEADPWMDVLGNGKLKKKVVKEGKGRDSRPVIGDIVTVRCEGKLEDGTEVDKHPRLTFTLGDGDVIQAMDLCATLMEEDEIAEVVTDALYAHGSIGRKPDIPPNATITYTVEMLQIEEAPDYSTLPLSQRIEIADQKRERGNYLYSRSEYAGAINSYSKALKIIDDENQSHKESAEQLQQLVDLRVKCYNNLAANQLKVEAFDAAMKSCDSVLRVQADNVKALFRKGKCLAALGDITKAVTVLRKALELEPESKIIHQELSKLVHKQKAQEKSERAMYQRMLGTDKSKPVSRTGNKWPAWVWLAGTAVGGALISIGIATFRNMSHA